METEKTALLFKALGDENRLRILKLVSQGEDLCACRILDELDITQPTLSHHMKILKDAGLISARKQGRWMHYSISENAINKGVEFMEAAGGFSSAEWPRASLGLSYALLSLP